MTEEICRWYAVQLLFSCSIDAEYSEVPLWEESIRLVRGSSEDAAHELAKAMAAEKEHEYKNEQGQTVAWRFVRILEVQEIDDSELVSGTEVWSRLFRAQPHANTGAHE